MRSLSRAGSVIAVLLAIECLDELVYGTGEAARPMIRTDLGMSYAQIGLLLSVPAVVGGVLEVLIGVLGDTRRRRALILTGGVFFCLSLAGTALCRSFVQMLACLLVFFPASGAFVSLSQASLMDHAPDRREQNMARWALAGSAGVVAGPLLLAAAGRLGIGWRGVLAGYAAVSAAMWLAALSSRIATARPADRPDGLLGGLREAARLAVTPRVLRWLLLLAASDLMLDIFLGFLALYFVDAVRIGDEGAALAVALWSAIGLIGDALLIPLIERVRGLAYLRVSAAAVGILFPTFLLVPSVAAKLCALALLGLTNAGWYSILKAQLYASVPARSGTVMALGQVTVWLQALVPLAIGLLAHRAGIATAMWILMLGPIALLLGLPRSHGTGRRAGPEGSVSE